jgi:hypothetical protein
MSITYCFSTATMVTRTHLGVTMHVHWLSCSCHGTMTYRRNRGLAKPTERSGLRCGNVTSRNATSQQGRTVRSNNPHIKEISCSRVIRRSVKMGIRIAFQNPSAILAHRCNVCGYRAHW